MKIIVEKITRQVKYAFDDATQVIMNVDTIVTDNLIIGDLNINNSELISVETVPENPLEYCYTDQFILIAHYQFALKKENLYEQLGLLRAEMANVVTQVQLANETQPQELTDLMPFIRQMNVIAKGEIGALTPEDIDAYVLRGPMYENVINQLKSLL